MKRMITLLAAALLLTGCQESSAETVTEFESVSMPSMSLEEIAELMQMDSNSLEMGIRTYGTVENTDTTVISVKVNNAEKYGTVSACQDSYIIVAAESGAQYYQIGDGSYFADGLYLCDIDGDASDEIVVQQLAAITGGAGGYRSFIFELKGGELQELFQSYYGDERFDTGFSSELKDGWKLAVSNRFTGNTAILDFSNTRAYEDALFDKDGNVLDGKSVSGSILVDSFREFVPEDVDGDGIYEISCLQYLSLYGHSDYIGNARSILKYDEATGAFKVIEAEFVPDESRLRER